MYGEAMGGVLVFYLLLLLVGVAIAWFLARKFADIATQKGHDGDTYFWYVFLLGIVGMVMVAALPDEKLRSDTAQILCQLTGSNQSAPVAAPTPPPAPAIQPGAVTEQVYKKSTNDPNRQNTPVSAVIQGDQKVCPKCGTAQRHDRRICWFCGQHFDN